MSHLFLNNPTCKSIDQKRMMLKLCILNGNYNIADFSKELNTSIPTTTKLITEMINEGFLEDKGKSDTNGGRRPSIYGLNSDAGYFVGIEVSAKDLSIAIMDFKGTIINIEEKIPFALESTIESLVEFCELIKNKITALNIPLEKISAYGISLTGRVDSKTGYCFSYFIGEDKPIKDNLEELLDAPVFVDNDSRTMTYGEYMCGICHEEKDILFINISMGLGMGMILGGKLNYGSCGYSGEIGHFPLLNNEKICKCGKIGCLETGASGIALHDILIDKLSNGRVSVLSDRFNEGKEISVQDILNAIDEEDILAIECMEEVGRTLGKATAGLINLLNPELVVIGGKLSEAGDYLMIPLQGAINKYTLTLVNKGTQLKVSKLGTQAGPIGACMLSRSKLLGFL